MASNEIVGLIVIIVIIYFLGYLSFCRAGGMGHESLPVEKLRALATDVLPELIEKLRDDRRTLLEKREELLKDAKYANADDYKARRKEEATIIEKEILEICDLIDKAVARKGECEVLLTKYDSAKRRAERNKEAGKILEISNDEQLQQVEEEIKEFLKSSLEEKLKTEK